MASVGKLARDSFSRKDEGPLIQVVGPKTCRHGFVLNFSKDPPTCNCDMGCTTRDLLKICGYSALPEGIIRDYQRHTFCMGSDYPKFTYRHSKNQGSKGQEKLQGSEPQLQPKSEESETKPEGSGLKLEEHVEKLEGSELKLEQGQQPQPKPEDCEEELQSLNTSTQ